jgi:hypothetical protein
VGILLLVSSYVVREANEVRCGPPGRLVHAFGKAVMDAKRGNDSSVAAALRATIPGSWI